MARSRRVDVRGILADPDLRRKLMVSTIQATQSREGIETTPQQAEQAYYVVTEADQTAFFDLERFRAGNNNPDRREEMFVRALRREAAQVRFDVARQDFAAIDESPLAYRRVGLVSHIFREAPALDPAWGIARQGKATGDDGRWVRQWWEVTLRTGWTPFAKGGDFCRFYQDIELRIDWKPEHREALKAAGNGLPSLEHYFKAGLTWPLRTQRGFNLRVMPQGCVFAHMGPAILLRDNADSLYVLGVANSSVADFILRGLATFGSWEVGVIKRLPVPHPSSDQREKISRLAKALHDTKGSWDQSNEACTHFTVPWLLRKDLVNEAQSIVERLERLAAFEVAEEARLRELYDELDGEIYRLYGISDASRAAIEEILGERSPEVLWPLMEGKTTEQKRMEYVWRLLSYVVKRVIETDEDGIIPFVGVSGELGLLDRVHGELAALFPGREVSQVEAEITNELKRKVGYKRVDSIGEWLENVFFDHHVSPLYKNRPIFWHIASSQGGAACAFGALIDYHKFDKNRMARLRSTYLREAMDTFRREAALADKEGRADDRVEWQAKLEEAQDLDRRLQWVQEGHHEGPEDGDKDYRILTPWKKPHERPKGWDPDLDDGVKVNIEPLQRAGVLRLAKVV